MDIEFNRNADLLEESLEEVLSEGGEPSCDDFLVCGKCPRERYLSSACPFNIISKGYELCEIKKEA